MDDLATNPPQFNVTVPMRTTQTFTVEAKSPAEAKRKVQAWFRGERDEGVDLWVSDDIGMVAYRTQPRRWTVTEA